MVDEIRVGTADLRAAAVRHRETADYLAAVPASHVAIQASLDSLGPIYGELAEAGRQLLEQRRQCYEEQAAEHAELADRLVAAAQLWDEHERSAEARFRGITDERR